MLAATRVFIAAMVVLIASAPLLGQTRPVAIGLIANYEQELARSANVGYSRIDILWRAVNPANGVWDFAAVDSQINDAVADGQLILGVLHEPPAWVIYHPNFNKPPRSTAEWAEFVRRVAIRYHGKIQAYEIWNEPDLKNSNDKGIGWDRDIEEPPLYVDFLRAAALQIRANSPGTLVVAPVFASNNNSTGSHNRKKRILQQICTASYPEGSGWSFIDRISMHANARNTEASRSMAWILAHTNLAYFPTYCGWLASKEAWITEYGWKSSYVGEAGQREKICNLTKMFTGRLDPGEGLPPYNIRRGYIYLQKGNNTTAAIFRENSSPKPAVTQYLQLLPYRATQQPALSAEYPNCKATGLQGEGESFTEPSELELSTALEDLGLSDPSAAVPSGYFRTFAYVDFDSGGVGYFYENGLGGRIAAIAGPLQDDIAGYGFLSESGAQWSIGKAAVSVTGADDGEALGKEVVRAIAEAFSSGFNVICKHETFYDGEVELSSFAVVAPATPSGFALDDSQIEVTRYAGMCGGEMVDPIGVEASWTFSDATGVVIRAGASASQAVDNSPTSTTSTSRHWLGASGVRYWVAAWNAVEGPALDDLLDEVATSMGGEF